MRYAYCRKDFRVTDYCVEIPVALLFSDAYRDLSVDACFLYSYLLKAQMLAKKTDRKGYGYVPATKGGLMQVLRCKKEDAEKTLAELSDKGAGLISVKEQEEGALHIYVKDYTRPILPPKARRKFGI